MPENTLWIVNQAGILLEIIGAVYIVYGSFHARLKIDRMFRSLEGLREIPKIRDIIKSQARMELNGFLFLSVGLIMQFIAGFGD